MGIIFKQSLKGAAYSYTGTALGFLITGLLLPNFFSTSEVGLLRVLISYGILFAQFANLGLSSVTVKVFPFFRDQQNKHSGFLGFTLLIGLFGVIISTALFFGLKPLLLENAQDKSELFITYANYVLPLILFTLLFNLFDTYYRVLYNAVKGIFYKEVVQRVLILLVVLAYYFKFIDFHSTVIFYVLANILPTVFILGVILRDKLFFIIPSATLFKKKFLKEFFSVAIFGFMNSFSGVLALNIDIIMISTFVGLSATGIYSITFFFGALIVIPARPMIKISSVVVSDAWKSNDLKVIRDIYQKSSLTLVLIGLLILIGIWGNIDNVFHLIKDEYLPGKYVILIIGLANIIDLANGVGKQIVFNSKYYRNFSLYLLFYISSLILLNFLFIPAFGILGAAFATLLSKFIFNLIIYLHIYAKHGIEIFNYRYILLVLIAFIAYYLSTLMPAMDNFILDIVLRSSLISILYITPVIALRISPDLNENLGSIIRKIRIQK